jgi:DNA repair protein RadD
MNCLVLDFAGNVKRHGPIDTITVTSATKAKDPDAEKQVLAKECPTCASLVALNAAILPDVRPHLAFERRAAKARSHRGRQLGHSLQGAPSWISVDSVRYYAHKKEGSPDSLRVEYQCGFTVHKEWVCFSHSGYARQKAEGWWLARRELDLCSSID